MIIKIMPADSKEAIAIMLRDDDEVTIGECSFEGVFIPTDIGLYQVRMNEGGIEVLLARRGEEKLQLVFSPGIMEVYQAMTDEENQPPQFAPELAFKRILSIADEQLQNELASKETPKHENCTD